MKSHHCCIIFYNTHGTLFGSLNFILISYIVKQGKKWKKHGGLPHLAFSGPFGKKGTRSHLTTKISELKG